MVLAETHMNVEKEHVEDILKQQILLILPEIEHIRYKHTKEKPHNCPDSSVPDIDAKQLISVNCAKADSTFKYHRPFITVTLKIQQNKISMLENMTLRPKPTWHLDTYSQIKIMTQITCYVLFTFFTFYLLLYHTAWTNLATCETFNKLETDPEALDCGLVTQLATHCLNKSSYISQLTRTQAITQTIMKYLLLWTIHKTTHLNMDIQNCKKYNRMRNQFLTDKNTNFVSGT